MVALWSADEAVPVSPRGPCCAKESAHPSRTQLTVRIMRLVLATTVVLLLVAQGAYAGPRPGSGPNRRRPPTLALIYKGEAVQRAKPWTYCWSYTFRDGSGVGQCADGFPNYPDAAQVDAPARLVIRIPYPTAPENWFLHAYRVVRDGEDYDESIGPAEPIGFEMRSRRAQGKRVWDVVFRVEEPLRDYYIDTGGDLAQGDAFYSFHVGTTL